MSRERCQTALLHDHNNHEWGESCLNDHTAGTVGRLRLCREDFGGADGARTESGQSAGDEGGGGGLCGGGGALSLIIVLVL